MHLYHGTSEQFIVDAVQARLANQAADRFFEEFRYKPTPSEVMDAPTRDFFLSRTE